MMLPLTPTKPGKEHRNECRRDPTVTKNALIAIARKKQTRSIVTEFNKYRAQQARFSTRQTAAATLWKRIKAEALSTRQDTLNEVFNRAAQ